MDVSEACDVQPVLWKTAGEAVGDAEHPDPSAAHGALLPGPVFG